LEHHFSKEPNENITRRLIEFVVVKKILNKKKEVKLPFKHRSNEKM
jgi:hypothetical protein